MRIEYREEIKRWIVYFLAVSAAIFIHELGHCIAAWMHGITAIPTPAKEYTLGKVPAALQPSIALGGILGSVTAAVLGIVRFLFKRNGPGSAILAGSIASPGLYSLFFLIRGRGHDATEFQDAQTALGFSYAGHSVDYLFMAIFLLASAVWLLLSKPTYRVAGRLLLGALATIIFIVGLQHFNNVIFDPLFEVK